ncbi:hypothetical protein [Clostridium sp.]|uniref:hypothetical protein n=1 Tax=Clostridium sp. TaxID=1506 RepID=UPI0026046D64|nr:hypothetical protein [Clostridium sp.]
MARKVKTKKKRNYIMNDEFMNWFIKARFDAMKPKLPHEYIYSGKLYQIILNYDKWHKEKYGKTTKEYIMQDYLQFLKDSQKENEILELMKLKNYTDEELLEYAKKEKIKDLKEIN